MVIVWHLRADPDLRFVDLDSDFSERRVNEVGRTKELVGQLVAAATWPASVQPSAGRAGSEPGPARTGPGDRAQLLVFR